MAELDEELQAYYEELERQRQEERERRRRELARAARQVVTKRAKQEVKRRAMAYAAEVAGSVMAAIAPYILPVLAFIAIGALIIFVTITTVVALCNAGGFTGRLAQVTSAVGGAFGLPGGGWCEKLSGLKGLAGYIDRGQAPFCQASQGQVLASEFNVPYPAAESPELVLLTTCIERELRRQNLDWGSRFTYEKSNDLCNYTRGTQCGPCAHQPYSCHYGGRSGTRGAEAVDYGNERIANEIIRAARFCGAGNAVNEGDHVHISTPSCSGDAGD